MRIKDIIPIKQEIKKVAFVKTGPESWEIHFWIGEGMIAAAVTMHWPSQTPRTWKYLDNAFNQAVEIFDLQNFIITIEGTS